MNKINHELLKSFFLSFMLFMLIFCFCPSLPASAQDIDRTFKKHELSITGEDSASIVFIIMGDGFKKSEQKKFNTAAEELVDYITSSEPFSEMKEYMNFYSVDVVSNESGAGDNQWSLKDTYFKSCYNYNYGIERLLCPNNWTAVYDTAKYYVPEYDQILIIVNDDKYGGSGGVFSVTSVNSRSSELMLHELGHSIGGLNDEYWAGSQYVRESPNMTQVKDPKKVKWKDYIGIEGIGVYPYEESPTWYHPSESCKMKSLNTDFCIVCSQALKERLQELRWKSNRIITYYDILNNIRVKPSGKTLYLNRKNKNSIRLKVSLPAILNRVKEFEHNEINIDDMEVKLSFKSLNKKIASVSSSGKVKGRKKGTTSIIITAELADGTKHEFTTTIRVK